MRRSPLLFTVPLALLALLVLILLWEAVRANVPPGAEDDWPWRLRLLDMEALGSLLAVATGAVLARAQYARTVRPYLGYRGSWRKGLLGEGKPAWRVGILNAGQHTAVVDSWECRVVLRGMSDEVSAPWAAVPDVVSTLTAAGLSAGRDYQLIAFGAGFPLVGTGNYDTVPVGVFSQRCVERIESLHIRVRVTDVVGDSHERVLDCMRGARAEYNAPGAEPVNE
ncbi:hypothetical protein [Streptomyces sp. sk226]|uniref:hypothetical protein n=1 Tax=Streptomyces sp. sk226 TaxID=2034268 RepID=UPI00211D843F|nr:hypothetical protein [Streptomyces sp. sk226]